MTPIQPEGFRFHLRHVVILVVFFTVLVAILTPAARSLGAHGVLNPPVLLLVAAPWLLAMLILGIERTSPVKFWAAPLLLSLIAPVLALCHNWMVLEGWFRSQAIPSLFQTLVLNVGLIGTFTLFAFDMSPRRCPECRSWRMIPLRGFWGPAARTPTTRWCARCGALYWRTRSGEWKQERRRTWLDPRQDTQAPGSRKEERTFDKDARSFSPKVCNGRAKAHASLSDSNLEADSAEMAQLRDGTHQLQDT